MATITASGIALPEPSSFKLNDEIIWSSNTGRGTTGKMTGDVVAEKQTLEVTWEFLRESELATIRRGLPAGFFSMKVENNKPWTGYRDSISVEDIGDLGDGKGHCYRSVSTKIIQQ